MALKHATAGVLVATCVTIPALSSPAGAAVEPKRVEFVGCYNQIGATGDLGTSGVKPNVQRYLKFETHGPGSADPNDELTFRSDDAVVDPQVVSVGATGSGVAIFTIAVPRWQFDWLMQLNSLYHGVYVQYQYDRDSVSGAVTFKTFHVGLPPPSLPRCTAPNPTGS